VASYSFQIRKSDHPDGHGTFDLYVHVWKNEYRHRKLLGRYRLPSLEPIFQGSPELNETEIKELAGWLKEPGQLAKLQGFLRETLFNIHKFAKMSPMSSERLDLKRARPTLRSESRSASELDSSGPHSLQRRSLARGSARNCIGPRTRVFDHSAV
jgi:hypothetical protein